MAQHTAFIPAIDAQPARELLWHNVKVWEDIAERMDDDGVIQKSDLRNPLCCALGEGGREKWSDRHRRL